MEKVSEELGGFRKGKGCVDQIFVLKMVVEEYLRKGTKSKAESKMVKGVKKFKESVRRNMRMVKKEEK